MLHLRKALPYHQKKFFLICGNLKIGTLVKLNFSDNSIV